MKHDYVLLISLALFYINSIRPTIGVGNKQYGFSIYDVICNVSHAETFKVIYQSIVILSFIRMYFCITLIGSKFNLIEIEK